MITPLTKQWASRKDFDVDAAKVCESMGEAFDSRAGKAARFLLALMPCDADWKKIAELTGLSVPTVKKYREIWWVQLCEKSDKFRYDWLKEGLAGDIAFVLDVLVMEGKITRWWDEEAKDFCYQAIKKDAPKPRPQPMPPDVTETKWSARREGLVAFERERT